MSTVQQAILTAFYARLEALGTIDQLTLDALRKAFQSGAKLKADEFVSILATPPTEGPP